MNLPNLNKQVAECEASKKKMKVAIAGLVTEYQRFDHEDR